MYELPKKQNRAEAKVDTKVAEKLRQKHPHRNWGLEVKIKGGRLKKHQTAALKQVEDGTFLYKIPDQGARNPFDIVYLGDADAIVCVVDGKNVTCDVNGGVLTYNFRLWVLGNHTTATEEQSDGLFVIKESTTVRLRRAQRNQVAI